MLIWFKRFETAIGVSVPKYMIDYTLSGSDAEGRQWCYTIESREDNW